MDDRATVADYSDPMSEKLLGPAADMLRSFGSAFGGRHLAIVGGAVPSLLADTVPLGIKPHVGTCHRCRSVNGTNADNKSSNPPC